MHEEITGNVKVQYGNWKRNPISLSVAISFILSTLRSTVNIGSFNYYLLSRPDILMAESVLLNSIMC